MKTSDLRIGNCLLLRDTIVKIGGIPNQYCLLIPQEQYAVDLEKFSAISITEKIILKCGFGEVGFYNNTYHKDNFRIIIGKDSCLFQIYEDESCIGIELNFLHQLQNLYFALTGKELEVNI